jgi:hypothetical protein
MQTNEKTVETAAGGPSPAVGVVTGTQLISGNLYRLPNEKLDAYCPAGALTFRRFFI